MRISAILMCFFSLGVYAQITIPADQTRAVLSSAALNSDVGSPILAVGGVVASWSVVSQTNPPGLGPATDAIYFDIDEDGQISVLQSLDDFFPLGSPEVEVVLNLRVFDNGGLSDTETVTITIVEFSIDPNIAAGQTRNILVTAEEGANVGSPLTASGSPTGWTINSETNPVIPGIDPAERFFDINNSGQISVLKPLDRFFANLGREDQVAVTLNVTALTSSGGSDTENVTIFVVEPTRPTLVSAQVRQCATDYTPNQSLQGPLLAVGDPTYFNIVAGSDLDTGSGTFSAAGAFNIAANGQLSTALFLDQFYYVANPTEVTLSIVAGNQYGESAPTDVTVRISVVGTIRCGFITPTQTRYVSSVAVAGDNVGFPVDMHGIDSVWIDAAWLDGDIAPNTDVATYFTIDTNGGSFGQISISRDLSAVFDPDLITRVRLRLRGHVFEEQCESFDDEEVFVYVLPSDADPNAGTGGGTGGEEPTEPDFSGYIDDANLLACIRERLGLTNADTLTAGAILGTTNLDCGCRNSNTIADLDGIHLFSNLQELNLSNNLISDVRPLTLLSGLTDLRLAGNLIADITTSNPFASMVNMIYIDLSYNQIRDTNAFSTMSQLQFISLANNDICDVASLVALADNGAIAAGDTVNLDGNHMLSSAGQSQLADLQNSGAFVTVLNNDGVCGSRDTLQLTDWGHSDDVDITAYTELINTHEGLPACGN